jgi:hypothetical protein
MQIDDVSKVINHSKTWNGFFFPNVHHFFSNLKRTLIWWLKEKKGIEIGEIEFYNIYWTPLVQIAFDSKNHKNWKSIFNKSYSFLYDKEHECIIYMMCDINE